MLPGLPDIFNQTNITGSLYLSKVTGGAIPEDEARQILSRFGAIEKLWYCSQTDLEMFRLPEGVWVMFAFFQDCRDAQAVSRCPTSVIGFLLTHRRASEMTQHTASSSPKCPKTCVPA